MNTEDNQGREDKVAGETSKPDKRISRRGFVVIALTGGVTVLGAGGAIAHMLSASDFAKTPEPTRQAPESAKDAPAEPSKAPTRPKAAASSSSKPASTKEEPAPLATTEESSAPEPGSASAETTANGAGASEEPAAPQAPASSEPEGVPSATATPQATAEEQPVANAKTEAQEEKSRVWHPAWDEWVEEGHYETTVIHHEAIYGERSIYGFTCYCGYLFATQDDINFHQASMVEQGYAAEHAGYYGPVDIGTETFIAQEAWDEEVRSWVDTSHWVHHEGYWE
jgi:hypothetical protein